MPKTITKEEAVENIEDGENLGTTAGGSEDSKNLRANLPQVLYI